MIGDKTSALMIGYIENQAMIFLPFKKAAVKRMTATLLSLVVSFCSLDVLAVDIQAQLQQCSTCHGSDGQSKSDIWPNLAGQKATYMAQQMRHIRDGLRTEPSMKPFVKSLSDEQIDALAQHYAAQKRRKPALAKKNLPGAHVRARCVSCHGMQGETVNDLWPNLAGQKSAYLLKQLRDYRSGKRQHPIMQVIAGELSDEQSKDVSEYYAAQ